jgi:hypothetical protein
MFSFVYDGFISLVFVVGNSEDFIALGLEMGVKGTTCDSAVLD